MAKVYRVNVDESERARRFQGKQRIASPSSNIPTRKGRKKDESKREIVKIETGYKPRPLQKTMHLAFKRFNVAVCHRRFGKCCVASTPVFTPNGFKKIVDVGVGDKVFSHDGKETIVTSTYSNGVQSIYKVVFDTGEEIETDADHLWYVERPLGNIALSRRESFKHGEYLTTAQLLESDKQWFIPLSKPVELPEKDLPIDPYLFGFWLGDGSKNSGAISVCHGDEKTLLPYKPSNIKKAIGCDVYHFPGLLQKFRDLEVFENKHIPEIYLTGSIAQRVSLVQGLMDSDGTVSSSKTCRFDNKNENLVDGFLSLIRGLGVKASKKVYIRGSEKEFYVLFRRREFDPFRLERKSKLAQYSGRPIRRKITSIIKTDRKESVYCFEIDHPSHLFLVGSGFIPTHNTICAINEIIDQALRNPLHMPQYAYIAPTMKQAREVAWQPLIDFTSRLPNVNVNKTEACIYIRRPDHALSGKKDPDHIKIRVVGADDPDSLRGIYLDGAVPDEYAQCNPILWGQIIRPALADRKKTADELGVKVSPPWVLFIGTPKGRNHFWRRYKEAREAEEFTALYLKEHNLEEEVDKWTKFEKTHGIHDNLPRNTLNEKLALMSEKVNDEYTQWREYKSSSNWYTALYKASDTGVIGQEEYDNMVLEMSPEEVAQELECDFAAAVLGSYYGKLMNDARNEGRITKVMYNPTIPVETYWDIGVGDNCTIWFRQKVNNMYHYLYYYQNNGKGVPHYTKVLDALAGPVGKRVEVDSGEYITGMGFKYGRHVWPHDGSVMEYGTGVSRQETARKLWGTAPELQSKQRVEDRIEATRKRIAISLFDEVHCKLGIECLENYQKKWDDKLMVFLNKPLHDWASHGSDSFGYSSLDDRSSSFGDVYSDLFGGTKNKPMFADGDYNELG